MKVEVETNKLLGGWIATPDKAEGSVKVVINPTDPKLKREISLPITSNPEASMPMLNTEAQKKS